MKFENRFVQRKITILHLVVHSLISDPDDD